MQKMMTADEINCVDLCENMPFHIMFDGMDFEIVRLSHLTDNERQWAIPFHAHESYEFHYISSGEGYIGVEDKQFLVQKGDFYITAPYVRHRQVSSAENIMEEYCVECKISFGMEAVSADQNDGITLDEIKQLRVFTTNEIYTHYKYTNDMLETCVKLQRLKDEMPFGYMLKIKTLLLGLLLDSLQIAVSLQENGKDDVFLGKEHFRLVKIKNYLDGNLCSDITIKDVAKEFYLSPRQLDRIILKGFGCSFYQYLISLRMNMAIRLLKQTDDTIMNIAAKSGFSSYQHLYRVLKRNGYDITKLRARENISELEDEFNEEYIAEEKE